MGDNVDSGKLTRTAEWHRNRIPSMSRQEMTLMSRVARMSKYWIAVDSTGGLSGRGRRRLKPIGLPRIGLIVVGIEFATKVMDGCGDGV